MKIATWNVNSIRSRLDRLVAWLGKAKPDAVCLQELKVTDDAFPFEPLSEAGYHAAVFGQKTYNGVAILSRNKPLSVRRGMDDGAGDPQARLIVADLRGVHVVSVYVPNGQSVGSEQYDYKLQWIGRLRKYLEANYRPSERLVVCGDFNVARDDLDVAHPELWGGTVLCHEAARAAFEELLAWGLSDVFRALHPDGGLYSWWDYRQLAFPRNNGLRLDYVLATAPLAEHCSSAEVDRDERKGSKTSKPSDHAPVRAEFEGL